MQGTGSQGGLGARMVDFFSRDYSRVFFLGGVGG